MSWTNSGFFVPRCTDMQPIRQKLKLFTDTNKELTSRKRKQMARYAKNGAEDELK